MLLAAVKCRVNAAIKIKAKTFFSDGAMSVDGSLLKTLTPCKVFIYGCTT